MKGRVVEVTEGLGSRQALGPPSDICQGHNKESSAKCEQFQRPDVINGATCSLTSPEALLLLVLENGLALMNLAVITSINSATYDTSWRKRSF